MGIILAEIIISFIISVGSIICFKFYFKREIPFKLATYINFVKAIFLTPVYFFIVNALRQSGFSSALEFGLDFQNLPGYLTFFATILTAYLLYKTFKSQGNSNNVSAFENRFFKFIDYHRENVSQLKYRDPKSKKEKYFEGNQVFTVIYYEIRDLLEEYLSHYSGGQLSQSDKREAINFIYQCIFYGAGEDGARILKNRFSNGNFDSITFLNKGAKYSGLFNPKRFYSGHVRRLGHYFRNLYQAMKYLEDQNFLSAYQKYEYACHLRAQMSVYEQSIFFFNSLSDLGKAWEFEKYDSPFPENERQEIFQKLMITKYDLIRNTLTDDGFIIPGINIKEFYPLICLERTEEYSVYGILPFKDNKKYICRFCFNEKYIGYPNKNFGSKIVQYYTDASDKELSDFQCYECGCKSLKEIEKIKKGRKAKRELLLRPNPVKLDR